MKLSIISEGGSIAGAYSFGVLSALSNDYGLKYVDYATGSSAGIANLSFYITGCMDEGHDLWLNYISSIRFLNRVKLLLRMPILNIDYLFTHAEKGSMFKKIKSSKTLLIIPLTNAKTGKAEYFDNRKGDYKKILTATMALPGAYGKRIKIRDKEYIDGGLSTIIPANIKHVKDSLKIIILTKSIEEIFHPETSHYISDKYKKQMTPLEYKLMIDNDNLYLKELDKAIKMKNAIIIQPKATFHRYNNKKKNIINMINLGRNDALKNVTLRRLISKLKKSVDSKKYFSE